MSCNKIVIEIIDGSFVEPFISEVIEIASGIVWCDALNNTYPDAQTPLSDTDKLLVQQGGEWKNVENKNIGIDTFMINISMKLLIDKDGKYSKPHINYGIYYNSWVYFNNTLTEAMTDPYNKIPIPKGYYISEVIYSHIYPTKDYDVSFIGFKSELENDSNYNVANINEQIIFTENLQGLKYGKKYLKFNPTKYVFKENEVFGVTFNSNRVETANYYIQPVVISIIFKRDTE